jgi:hypothetical protein
MVLGNSPLHRMVQPTLVLARIPAPLSFALLERDPRSIRQHPERFRKCHTFLLHQKTKNITTQIAHPALPTLPVRIDLHARMPIIVPRAPGHKTTTLPAQLQVAADDIDNVDRKANAIFRSVVEVDYHVVS